MTPKMPAPPLGRPKPADLRPDEVVEQSLSLDGKILQANDDVFNLLTLRPDELVDLLDRFAGKASKP